jgi:hypothetical protein
VTRVADGLWHGVRPIPIEVDDCPTRPCRGREAWLEPERRNRTHGEIYTPETLRGRMTVAIDACNQCPVLGTCRTWALTETDPMPAHTAGGMTTLDRRDWRRLAVAS